MKDSDKQWVRETIERSIKLHKDYDRHEYPKAPSDCHQHCADCGKIFQWNMWYPAYKYDSKLCNDCNLRHQGPLTEKKK